MKLVNYDKFKRRSCREMIFFAILYAVLCGVMIGIILMQMALGRDLWTWGPGLVWAVLMGLGSLESTLATLHQCSPPANESQPSNQKVA